MDLSSQSPCSQVVDQQPAGNNQKIHQEGHHQNYPGYGELPQDPPPYKAVNPLSVQQQSRESAVVQVSVVGSKSISMVCPHCNSSIQTAVALETSRHAYIMSAVLCVLGFWVYCCCCCAPCMMDSCMNAKHLCPECKTIIGTYMC